jgi:hypothetical protein
MPSLRSDRPSDDVAIALALPAAVVIVWLTVYAWRTVSYRRHAHQVRRGPVGIAVGEVSWHADRYRPRT